MPTVTDSAAIKNQKNFLTEHEEQELTQTNGIWQFYFNFLSSAAELTEANGYDPLLDESDPNGPEDDEPENQSMEYAMFVETTALQQGMFNLVMGLSTSQGAYDYTVYFTDVVSNLNFADMHVSTELPITADNAHINIGQAGFDFNSDGTVDSPGVSVAYAIDSYNSGEPLPPTYAYSMGYDTRAHGDIWLNSGYYLKWTNIGPGSAQLATVIHELGHAIGLRHPVANSDIDNAQYTIMSYNYLDGMTSGKLTPQGNPLIENNNDSISPGGLQMYDILAMQEIFQNRNYATRDGNEAYKMGQGFGATANTPFIYTIWDGKGIDVLDASDYADKVEIDLRQGEFSSIGKALDTSFSGTRGTGLVNDNVGIAFYTVIENAKGTAGDDKIIGNAWNNVLFGGDGVDHIYGDGVSYDGAAGFHEEDEYRAWNGTDNLAPDADDSGDDVLAGGKGDDVIFGGRGADVLHGGFDEDDIDDATQGRTIAWDSAGQFSSLDDIAYAEDGFDTANYSGLTGAGINVAFTTSGNTVEKGPSGSLGTDKLYSIERVIGTAENDVFRGSLGAVETGALQFQGGGGSDTYIFDIATHRGEIKLSDLGTKGIDLVKFENVGSNIMISYAPSNKIMFYAAPLDPEDPPIFLMSVEYDSSSSSVIENTQINSQVFRTESLHQWLETGNWAEGQTVFADDIYNQVYNNGGTGGTGSGGGATPIYDPVSGDIEGMTVRPDLGGRYTNFVYADEVLHQWVITSYAGGSGSYTMTLGTYIQSINILPGIAAEDVRFTVSSNLDDAALTIHIDSLGVSHTIQNFEAGKHLTGLAFYDASTHAYVQADGSATLASTGQGQFQGSYSTPYSFSSGFVEVTYFLQTVNVGGTSINMQAAMTLTGTDTGEVLYGLNTRGDILKGLAGNDDLRGYDGDDTLIGGTGADQLIGGLGNDTYFFEAGFASGSGSYDTIYEYAAEGTDKIVFGSGINADDVRTWTDFYGYLHIQSVLDPQDYVRVMGSHTGNGTDVNQRIEQITFSDETTWDLTQGLILNDSDDAHSGIYGSAQGDIINGNGGNDDIRGWNGDDTINGGTGADQLSGDLGDDTFVFENGFANWNGSNGYDMVYENLNEGFDTIHFGDGLTPDDLRMWTDFYGYLHIQSVLDPQDYVRVMGSHTGNGVDVNQRIEQITFSDETAWDLTQGLILNDSDDAHGSIYGSSLDDTISGNGGDDNIRGWDGDDTISGGTGADQLSGGLGADTFVFFAGDVGTGSDTLWDFSLAQGDKIDLRDVLDAGYDPITDALADFVQFTNSGSHSTMSVDMDGAGTTYGWSQIATVYNHTNLDPDAMVTAGQLLAA